MVEKLAIPFFALGDSVRLFERQLAFKDRRIRRVDRCRGRGVFRLRRRATGGRDSEPTGINVTDSTGATTARQFYVSIPSTYDPSTTYRLIFVWHYYSGSAAALAAVDSGGVSDAATSGDPPPVPGFYGVQPLLPDAIYVAGQGLPITPGDASTSSWTNTNGEDIAFAKIAWMTARDQFLADNHCGATMEPVDPSPCVSYDGCDSGDPVVWCPVEGEGHAIPSFAAGGIATFFSQF